VSTPKPQEQRAGWLSRLRGGGPFLAIWPALAVLVLISPLLANGSLSQGSILTVLAFAGILALAAAGQTLIVQQGGLDLSVPGAISVSAVIVTKYPAGSNDSFVLWLLVALAVGAAAGVLVGVIITRFNVTPLVATLGMNALFSAAVLSLSQGSSAYTAPPALDHFAVGRFLGIPNVAWLVLVVVVVIEVLIRTTAFGRRFVAIGTNPRAARAAGLGVTRYRILTYTVAGVLYAAAGILLAGYLGTPNLLVGSNYLLPSVAAVVLGGTSLLGGSGSVVATAGGALFLIQLQQVTQGMGASAAVQNIITAVIIAVGMAARVIPGKLRGRRPKAAPPRPTTPVAANTS
jgi:ribose transport system permease protein